MTKATFDYITDEAREARAEQAAICLRGVFGDRLELLREGVERTYNEAGPYFSENLTIDDSGRNLRDAKRLRENWFAVLQPHPGSQEKAHG